MSPSVAVTAAAPVASSTTTPGVSGTGAPAVPAGTAPPTFPPTSPGTSPASTTSTSTATSPPSTAAATTAAATTAIATTTTTTTFAAQPATTPGPTPIPGPLDARCSAPVSVRPPALDFAAVVAAAPPGTCFRLAAGEYRFHDVEPKDGMTFLGASRADVAVVGSGLTENAFHGTARGVTIGRMTVRGFQGSAGQLRQQQAAIRGSAGIWRTAPGQLASGWLIEDVELSGNYALGLLLGDRFTVRHSTFAANGVAGLGGADTHGGLVQGNVVTGNGDQQLTGYEANGGGMKFTEASGFAEPLVIDHNEVHHNRGTGVWCDIGCTGLQVTGNYIHDQDSHGVVVELSSHALIRGNLIVNANSWTDFAHDFNAGAVTVAESSGVTVEGNYIDGARAGVVVRQTRRPVLPQEGFLLGYPTINWTSGDVLVTGNVVVNTRAMGVSTGTTGAGLIADPSSIRYVANTYGDPRSVEFWWDGGRRFDFTAWQAAGRDIGGGGVAPARPVWTALTG